MTVLAPAVGFNYMVTNDDTPPSDTGFGTLLTNGGANTKGTWVAIHATIDADLFWHHVTFTDLNTTGTNVQGLADLGIGPDSSNVTTVAENLICGNAPGATIGQRTYTFPLFVPAGTQLWGRCQTNLTTPDHTVRCAVSSWGGADRPAAFPVPFLLQSIGANTADSTSSIAVTPGSSGASGTYAQLTASTSLAYIGVMAGHCSTDAAMTPVNGYSVLLGLGASTETELGLTEYATHDTAERIVSAAHPIWWDIPAASRLAAKMTCSGTPDSGCSVVAWGFAA